MLGARENSRDGDLGQSVKLLPSGFVGSNPSSPIDLMIPPMQRKLAFQHAGKLIADLSSMERSVMAHTEKQT